MFSKCGSVVLLLIFIGKDFFVEIIEKIKKRCGHGGMNMMKANETKKINHQDNKDKDI